MKNKISVFITVGLLSLLIYSFANASESTFSKAMQAVKAFDASANPVFVGEDYYGNKKLLKFKDGEKIFDIDPETNEISVFTDNSVRGFSKDYKPQYNLETAEQNAKDFKEKHFEKAKNLQLVNSQYLEHGDSGEFNFEFREKKGEMLLPSFTIISVDALTGKVFSSMYRNIESQQPDKIISKQEALEIAKSYFPDKDIMGHKAVLDQWPNQNGGIDTRWNVTLNFKSVGKYDSTEGKVIINAINGELLVMPGIN